MILDDIVADTRLLVSRRKAEHPEALLRERAVGQAPPLDLCRHLSQPRVSIIAEVKRASPSKGVLNLELEPSQQAQVYARAGAEAISVLTEPTRFRGRLEDLSAAREGLAALPAQRPLLRKDFVVDPYQLVEARAWGADAVLLIVAALDDAALSELMAGALALGMTPLVEVHNEAELARALAIDPPLIGINNRNLRDFTVDLSTTQRLRSAIPQGVLVVSESGIHQPEQMRLLAQMGVDAALIGEALVTASDPAAKLRELKEAGR
ncbi:MAG: indole-3-glycerol phosphate synthase TrpC [Anaerolineae bacterium]|nr:indole-3-glycerol phosphate synthase TrpC [Anaerolineae bacterium]